MLRSLLLAGFAAALAGCSVPEPWRYVGLDDLPADKIAQIDAIPDLAPGAAQYTKLADIEGVSCARSRRDHATWADAVRRTKFRAMEKGATAITDLQCEAPKGWSLTTVCWESIRCTATAIQVKK